MDRVAAPSSTKIELPIGGLAMNCERILIFAVLLLAAGLGLIFGYCHGSIGLTAGSPLSGSSLQLSITTTGVPALAGTALTLLGAVALLWALVEAVLQLRPVEQHRSPQVG